jgi:hypothetical protein
MLITASSRRYPHEVLKPLLFLLAIGFAMGVVRGRYSIALGALALPYAVISSSLFLSGTIAAVSYKPTSPHGQVDGGGTRSDDSAAGFTGDR